MVDTKLIILIASVILTGCATAPTPTFIPEQSKDGSFVQPPFIVSAPASPPPVLSPATMVTPHSDTIVNEIEKSAMISDTASVAEEPKKIFAAIKKEKLIDKVTSSVMSAAEAAITDKKETITYDVNGDVKEKTVEVDKGSFVGNITKLLGLLSATLGLYIGVKKFRQPDLRTV